MLAGTEVGVWVCWIWFEQVGRIGDQAWRGFPFPARWILSEDFGFPEIAGHHVDRPVEYTFPGGVLSGAEQQPDQERSDSTQDQK